MNTTLTASPRVLVVEPDPSRASALEKMLRPSISFELEVVPSADQALRSMSRRLPHLVMTSTFLSPADAAVITGFVRQLTPGWRLPVVDLPYAISTDIVIATDSGSGLAALGFRRRRSVTVRSLCDVTMLREYIEEYLQQSLKEPQPLQDRLEALALLPSGESMWLVPAPSRNLSSVTLHQSADSVLGPRTDRRRARRRRLEDLPARWHLKLSGAPDVDIVNISTSGVLLETAMQIVPGSIVEVQLVGQDRNLNVPARMLRTEVVGAGSLGPRYRVAAAFARELEVLDAELKAGSSDTASLASVLQRVSTEIDRAAEPVAAAVAI